MSGPHLLEVGRIGRPHGVRGEVVVDLTTDRHERVAIGATLQTTAGPLLVAASRPFGAKFLVRFEGVEDRNAADSLRGLALLAEPLDDADELWVHRLIGARVIDAAGADHGEVVAVQANPAADLLVLASGALVPVNFVVDTADGEVRVDTPAGLFELYENP